MNVRRTLVAFVALISCLGRSSTADAECLSSAKAVWAAHPGSHASWRTRDDVKCWFVGFAVQRVRRHDQETDGQAQARSQARALAADGPGESPARLESRENLPSLDRGPPSILIWGRPMSIDETWEEMFTRRERNAE
jgi:hypothetical protein